MTSVLAFCVYKIAPIVTVLCKRNFACTFVHAKPFHMHENQSVHAGIKSVEPCRCPMYFKNNGNWSTVFPISSQRLKNFNKSLGPRQRYCFKMHEKNCKTDSENLLATYGLKLNGSNTTSYNIQVKEHYLHLPELFKERHFI